MLGLNQLRVVAYFNEALLIIRIWDKDNLEPFSFFADEKFRIEKYLLSHTTY